MIGGMLIVRRAIFATVCASSLFWAEDILSGEHRVPRDSDQQAAERIIKEALKADYGKTTPDARKTLARKLLARATTSKGDLAAYFTCLREARDVAASAGDALLALEAVRQIAAYFDIHVEEMQDFSLSVAARAAQAPEGMRNIAEAYLVLVREAAVREDYERARDSVALAEKAARGARDKTLAASVQTYSREVKEIYEEYRRFQSARKSLLTEANDPRASLTVGSFLCFVRGDWREGLPRLRYGSDSDLSSVAESELKDAEDPKAWNELAEGWYRATAKLRGIEKAGALERSGFWQAKLLSQIPAGGKETVRQRLLEVALEYSRNSLRLLASRPMGIVVLDLEASRFDEWEVLSGDWTAAGVGVLSKSVKDGDRHLRSLVSAHWIHIDFEFQGGNPGLYLAGSKEEIPGSGVNLGSESKYNGEIKRTVDMNRWNDLRVTFDGGEAHFELNGEPVYVASLGGPRHIVVKANRGILRVRKLLAIGYNP